MRSQYVDSIAFSDIACILVVFVGIWSFCNSIIPRNGCRRLAKSTHFGAENHTVSVILQVAPSTVSLFPKRAAMTYVLLHVIPRLAPGVQVHVHDIFLSDDYAREWVLTQGRNWNE